MRVVALIPENDEQAGLVKRALEAEIPVEKLHIYSSASSVFDTARLPLDGTTILVVYVDGQHTLSQLASVRGRLTEVQMVLVLPTDEKAIVAIGHSLRPRVVLYVDHVTTQLVPILKRMQGRADPASQV